MVKKTDAEKNGRIALKDPALRAAVKELTKLDPTSPTTTAAIRDAVYFRLGYLKNASAPIDYSNAPLDLLRDYAVNGYDFTIRAPALAEIERRYKAAIVTEKEAQS